MSARESFVSKWVVLVVAEASKDATKDGTCDHTNSYGIVRVGTGTGRWLVEPVTNSTESVEFPVNPVRPVATNDAQDALRVAVEDECTSRKARCPTTLLLHQSDDPLDFAVLVAGVVVALLNLCKQSHGGSFLETFCLELKTACIVRLENGGLFAFPHYSSNKIKSVFAAEERCERSSVQTRLDSVPLRDQL